MTERICSEPSCDEVHYGRGWCQKHWQKLRFANAERRCSLPDCDEGHYAKDLCRFHYRRQQKTGDSRADIPKRGWGQQDCQFPGCAEPHDAGGYCNKHWRRQYKHGDPAHVEKAGWRGDAVGYTAMHERIYRMYGPAADHACQRCGGPATDWAYDHADPNERREVGKGPYSTDPAHYMALCHSCHMKLDHNGWD
jgi:hypothetical protein